MKLKHTCSIVALSFASVALAQQDQRLALAGVLDLGLGQPLGRPGGQPD